MSSDEDPEKLMEEAEMPLDQLLARYEGRGGGLALSVKSKLRNSLTGEEVNIYFFMPLAALIEWLSDPELASPI